MEKLETSLVFLGSGPVAAASLRHLAQNFAIEAVITKAVTKADMAALVPGTAVFTAEKKAELTQLIAQEKFKSRLAVIVDFGIIVEQAVIEAFPLGIVNSHFSLLPQWRGADPISFAILSGQPKTGVSLMLIEPTLDTGKLLVQRGITIDVSDTTDSLTYKLVNLSNELLAEYLPRYFSGQLHPRAQPHPNRATYSRKLTKQDGLLDWTKPAAQLEREIRAFASWPKSYTQLGGKDVIITRAHVVTTTMKAGEIHASKKELLIGTAQDALAIDKIKPAGKAEMPIQAFLAGYQQLFK